MATTQPRITTVRTGTGHFDVYLDGQKTAYQIVNGSLGLSGRGRNHYGIVHGTKARWIGPLNTCKLFMAQILIHSTAGASAITESR